MICLWVPGRFKLTNQMLSDLRSAGFFEGVAHELRVKARPGHDRFAAETIAIRLAAKVAVRRAKVGNISAPGRQYRAGFIVCGHYGYDPDAWYLLAKPALDGIVDGGGLLSDRRDVAETWGHVYGSPEKQRAAGMGHRSEPGVEIRLEW